jgi:hypothetical protein
MNTKKIAANVMAHYEKEYGNYAVFSCDCGYDMNGAAYTFVAFNESSSEEKSTRIQYLESLILHAEFEHVTPATVIVTPPPVAVNIVMFDKE